MEKVKNIYEKMSAITNEIDRVAKNLKVGVGQSQYKAVGESDILVAVKPIEEKYGVYSYPLNRELVRENEILSTTTYKDEAKEKITYFLRIKVTYRFVNIENPSEFIDIVSIGDGMDSQDKAPGKAMTYADKYALMKAYKIETGDDPDQNFSEPTIIIHKKVSENMLKSVEKSGINIEKLAIHLKKPVEEITQEELAEAIKTRQKLLKEKENANKDK